MWYSPKLKIQVDKKIHCYVTQNSINGKLDFNRKFSAKRWIHWKQGMKSNTQQTDGRNLLYIFIFWMWYGHIRFNQNLTKLLVPFPFNTANDGWYFCISISLMVASDGWRYSVSEVLWKYHHLITKSRSIQQFQWLHFLWNFWCWPFWTEKYERVEEPLDINQFAGRKFTLSLSSSLSVSVYCLYAFTHTKSWTKIKTNKYCSRYEH